MANITASLETTRTVRGYCALCTAHCATIATVENGRVTRLDADHDHPNGGVMCIKGKAAPARGKPMSMWDMAMTVREFARGKAVTFARLPIGWPGEAYEFDGPLSFMGNDGGGAVGTGPGHTIGAALAELFPS